MHDNIQKLGCLFLNWRDDISVVIIMIDMMVVFNTVAKKAVIKVRIRPWMCDGYRTAPDSPQRFTMRQGKDGAHQNADVDHLENYDMDLKGCLM